jgi:hypothetical protein
VTYSNKLEKIETIRDAGLIDGADPTIAALTGRIEVRLADTTLIDLAAGGTSVDLGVRLHALGAGKARAYRARGPPPEAKACGRRPRAASRRASTSGERCRGQDADADAHQ